MELFLDNKRGEHCTEDTLYRHKYITDLLLAFCERERIVYIKDVTLAHLTSWRTEWTLKAPEARRSHVHLPLGSKLKGES